MSKILLGEVDGSQMRLTLASPGARPEAAVIWDCASVQELDARLDAFMNDAGRPSLAAAAFCAAGPVQDDAIRLTHADMQIGRPHLRKLLGTPRVHLVNDFTACAMAVPHLDARDIEKVGRGVALHDMPMGVIGPWRRGCGVSTLAPDSSGDWFALPGEGGHVLVAATNDHEAEVLSVMRKTIGRISADEVVSETGLLNLQSAVAELAGQPRLGSVDAILTAATDGDEVALEALRLFTGWTGDIAGNLALTIGARGGVYICSELMAAHPALFDRALLRARFEDKGCMHSYVADIPLHLVAMPEVGLLGLSTLFKAADFRKN